MVYKPNGMAVSLAGRDKGDIFFVLEITEKTALLADGKRRTLEHPQRKNLRHVKFLPDGDFATVCGKISDRPVNAELRRAMAEYKATANK